MHLTFSIVITDQCTLLLYLLLDHHSIIYNIMYIHSSNLTIKHTACKFALVHVHTYIYMSCIVGSVL